MSDGPQPPNASPPRRGPHFGMGGLLMTMLVASVMAAAGFYGVQGWRSRSREFFLVFILVTLTSPVLLLVIVSGARALFDYFKQRKS